MKCECADCIMLCQKQDWKYEESVHSSILLLIWLKDKYERNELVQVMMQNWNAWKVESGDKEK